MTHSMKTILAILILFTATNSFAQINPLGIYIDIDGKIKFWESEANPNGNVDNPVYIRCGVDTSFYDLRNLKYDHLTFLDAPRGSSTFPSNIDPSRVNETMPLEGFTEHQPYSTMFIVDTIALIYKLPDSTKLADLDLVKTQKMRFRDEVRGDGLTDSIVETLKTKLTGYIKHYYGKHEPFEAREELHTEISHYDTVINKQAVYDYLVDKLVFYKYRNDKLTSIMGYHWNLGVEFDSLRYDEFGNLIYFSRESIGSLRDEFYFEYNQNGQVILAKSFLSGSIGESKNDLITDYIIETLRFTYSTSGILNSKSVLQKSGKWHTCYFQFNKGNTILYEWH